MRVCRSQQQLSHQVFLHFEVKRDLQTLFLLVHLKSYKQSNTTANSDFVFSQPPLKKELINKMNDTLLIVKLPLTFCMMSTDVCTSVAALLCS